MRGRAFDDRVAQSISIVHNFRRSHTAPGLKAALFYNSWTHFVLYFPSYNCIS
jgi:hypothetical protein